MDRALTETKVLELCQMVAGPYCGKLLADFGATVVKVEPPTGDPSRKYGPFLQDVPNDETSGLFIYLNTNKLGITLDITTETGRDLFRRLASQVDIVLEDCPPGYLDRWGIGYEDLARENPLLIMTSITPFGQGGPYKHYKAYHLNVFHGGGEGYVLPGGVQSKDRAPVKGGGFLGDYDAGLNAATATLAALFARSWMGQGQHVDVSRQEAVTTLNRTFVNKYPNEGVVEHRYNRSYAAGGLMRCADGWVEIPLAEEHQWLNFLRVIDAPEWGQDPRFKDRRSRQENGEALNGIIQEKVQHISKRELYHKAQEHHVPVGAFLSVDEVVSNPQMKARGFFQEVEHPVAGKVTCPTSPCHFAGTPWSFTRPAPLLGQHDVEVLSGWLGLSKGEVVQLRRQRVI
ncbi:MAG: CoA transferase [Chloroflexi bacterium]|nr:CoA transferase [Chloroflexota bacterium]